MTALHSFAGFYLSSYFLIVPALLLAGAWSAHWHVRSAHKVQAKILTPYALIGGLLLAVLPSVYLLIRAHPCRVTSDLLSLPIYLAVTGVVTLGVAGGNRDMPSPLCKWVAVIQGLILASIHWFGMFPLIGLDAIGMSGGSRPTCA